MTRSKVYWLQVRLKRCMLGLALLGAVSSLVAQEPVPESTAPSAESAAKADSPAFPAATPAASESDATAGRSEKFQLPERKEIEARLAEAAANPDDAASEAVVESYQQALSFYDRMEEQKALLALYGKALASAPDETRNALAALESTLPISSMEWGEDRLPSGLTKDASVDQINDRLNKERGEELAAKKKFEGLEETLSLQLTRPDEIRDRIAAINEELSGAKTIVEDLTETSEITDSDKAFLLRAQLQIEALEAEQAALEQEQSSYEVRLALLSAQRDLASRLASNAEAETEAIQLFADQHLRDSASDAAELANQARTETEDGPKILRDMAAEISQLAEQFEEVNRDIARVSNVSAETESRLNDLRRQYDQLKTQLEIGGLHEAQGEILLEQRRLMPSQRVIEADLDSIRTSTAATRMRLFQVRKNLQESPQVLATKLVEDMETSPGDSEAEMITGKLVSLIEQRNELLEELRGQYRRLLVEEVEYDESLRALSVLTGEARDFLNEKLIWVRSSDPVNLSTFTELPDGFAWLLGGDRIREVASGLAKLWERSPVPVVLIVIVFLLLISTQAKCKRKITDLGHKVQKISSDRYQFTFNAFLLSITLALPYPILMAFAGWGLLRTPDASDWLQGLGQGSLFSAYLLALLLLVRAICREGGLGEQHFRWRRQPLESVCENLTWISIFYIPIAIVLRMTLIEDDSVHLASLGRLLFVALMFWVAFFLRRMFNEKTGVMAIAIQDHPQAFIARFQKFGVFLLVSFPIIMALLALAGYTLTGFSLTRQFRLTIDIIGLGVLIYALVLRWFSMRERKLTLEQRIRERRERLEAEAREAEGLEAATSEEGILKDLEEDSIDFEEVGEQTRRLLRFVVGAVVGLAIWFGWADIVPALRGLESIKIMGGISLGSLIPAIFILIVTAIGAKNLPGLLEIGVLRHLPLDSGLRYAITSLCQYIVVAVGLSLTFGVLEVDWSKLGWIAAALSVGLGFGLQEVVANFVCGIILLFERPIRVGDVVTVSGTTGVVSKIRIRATTILDRDQKEFIVPNKEFITGSLLNWTLSTTLNRIVIVVGVAYGSDTRRARDLLLEICNAHPDVLKEPATNVVFDTFGDSTLNFTVRTYLASMENRLGVTNDLHHEIHDRFAAEGIEIAFPQMDLHLRSVDPGVDFGGEINPEPGKT